MDHISFCKKKLRHPWICEYESFLRIKDRPNNIIDGFTDI